MFIKTRRSGYTRDGESFIEGYFLILMRPESNYCWVNEAGHILEHVSTLTYQELAEYCYENLNAGYPVRGIVRYVRMAQLGNFMMARLRLCACPKNTICLLCQPRTNMYGQKNNYKNCLYLSGTYGSDGLICSVPMEFYQKGTILPQDLYDKWANGGGWNSAGNEAFDMRAWGMSLLSDKQEKNISNWDKRYTYTANY